MPSEESDPHSRKEQKESSGSMPASVDLEYATGEKLTNHVLQDFQWAHFNVIVKDRKTKSPLTILSDSSGIVHAGEILAIMGPSGSGKTTLLNAIAYRPAASGATTKGSVMADGQEMSLERLRQFSAYVEQEDALVGSLTVRETMSFAAGLSLPSTTRRAERKRKVEQLIASFGLHEQADTIVGTPIKKGLSGGQKKRLGVASRLVTDPRIIFLDEPTSGLDSTLSFEVVNYIRKLAKKHKLVVIASIHQPSTATFNLFDKVCLLAKGKTCYFGPRSDAASYFASIGYPLPEDTNPAEFYLDLVNTDLGQEETIDRMNDIAAKWGDSMLAQKLDEDIDARKSDPKFANDIANASSDGPSRWKVLWTLLHRSWIKAYRDIIVYNLRIIMYLGLAILMGTVFLRFSDAQRDIQPYINAIFFGGAFMSFMAVAYVPAFLEDLHTFRKERANGLVGPLSFSLANFLIGLPFLFAIVLIFSVVEYFLTGFRSTGTAFATFVMWLFLDLVAAESLVVLVSAIFPVFVIALAVTAFANGLWMCVDGFLVPMDILNPFWKYVFHYIDYQAYVFQGMMVNEFKDRTYKCQQLPSGTAVLDYLHIGRSQKLWVGYSLVIIFGYRLLAFLALWARKR